jgi:hypothetical protein
MCRGSEYFKIPSPSKHLFCDAKELPRRNSTAQLLPACSRVRQSLHRTGIV